MWRIFTILSNITIGLLLVANSVAASEEHDVITLDTATKLAVQNNPDLA